MAKVVDPETGEGPLVGEEGLLLVKGPNRMLGYLDDPELPPAAFRDGWYVTGDIASIDDDGFIRITDRLSRFSKIAGEMVPHMKVEEEIQALLDEGHTATVVSVPDHGERRTPVAFYSDPGHHARSIVGKTDRHVRTSPPVDSEARGPAADAVDPNARQRENRHSEPEASCREVVSVRRIQSKYARNHENTRL